MRRILFVCTGNTCRSSMAKALFEVVAQENQRGDDFEVDSAGIFASIGDLASQNTIEVMKEYGADLTSHRAKRLNKDMVDQAEIILCMTDNHKQQIIHTFPHVREKVHTLLEYSHIDDGEDVMDMIDIHDPFGQDIEAYKKCADDIYSALKNVYKRFKVEQK